MTNDERYALMGALNFTISHTCKNMHTWFGDSKKCPQCGEANVSCLTGSQFPSAELIRERIREHGLSVDMYDKGDAIEIVIAKYEYDDDDGSYAYHAIGRGAEREETATELAALEANKMGWFE